jgi:hypothetical protein
VSRPLYWSLWASTALTALTGVVFAVMRYLMEGSDPFSAYNHPLQPWALAAHVMLAPALVLALGWAWGAHAAPKLACRGSREEKHRRPGAVTGLSTGGIALAMIASGYGLQVTATEWIRLALAWAHGLSGGAFVLALGVHAVVALRAARTVMAARRERALGNGAPPQGQLPGNRSAPEDSEPQEPEPQAFWARTR